MMDLHIINGLDLATLWSGTCCGAYSAWLIYNAVNHPGKFLTLTYWTLCVHVLYHAIDKSTTWARLCVLMLHGVAWTGAISVFIGYGVMAWFGSWHHGSWLAWENAMCRLNNVPIDPFPVKLVKNLFVHAWPVVAMFVDLQLSWPALNRIYSSLSGPAAWVGVAWVQLGFFCFGNAWQKLTCSVRPSGKGTDTVERYQADPAVRKWLGRNDDFLFSLLVKLSGTAVALLINTIWVLPLLFRGGEPGQL